MNQTPRLRVAVAGAVDHGKTTLLNALMVCGRSRGGQTFHTGSVDALEQERAEGITLTTARAHLQLQERELLFFDNPGHTRYLPSVLSGASDVHCALLIVDGCSGVTKQTLLHARVLMFLGVKRVALVWTRLDRLKYEDRCSLQMGCELHKILSPVGPFLTSSFSNEGLESVLNWLIELPLTAPLSELPLLAGIQSVCSGSLALGTVESGVLRVGDEVLILPTCQKTQILQLPQWPRGDRQAVSAPGAFAARVRGLSPPERGDFWVLPGQRHLYRTRRVQALLFWFQKPQDQQALDCFLHWGFGSYRILQLNVEHLVEQRLMQVFLKLEREIVVDPKNFGLLDRVALFQDAELKAAGRILSPG